MRKYHIEGEWWRPETDVNVELESLRGALRKIASMAVEGPSPIGPLHGAGMSHGFDVCRQIANEALGTA